MKNEGISNADPVVKFSANEIPSHSTSKSLTKVAETIFANYVTKVTLDSVPYGNTKHSFTSLAIRTMILLSAKVTRT